MLIWSDSMFLSNRAHVPGYPLVASTDSVLRDPGGEPHDSCASPEAMLDLAAFSEGNLSTAGRRRLFAHLARCQTCRQIMASLDGDPPPAEPLAPAGGPGGQFVAHSQ